jgi:catechol 2,3-dioxygenase-like lactoylglutathione lyase family enzyme
MARTQARHGFTKLVVRDLQRSAAFYRAVCGYGEGQYVECRVADRPNQEIVFTGPDGRMELCLTRFPDAAETAPGGVIAGFFTDDPEGFQERLLAAGGAVVQPFEPMDYLGQTVVVGFFTDPDGILLEAVVG